MATVKRSTSVKAKFDPSQNIAYHLLGNANPCNNSYYFQLGDIEASIYFEQ